MKVALILCVVALVAVSQPWNPQVLPPKPMQPCQQLTPEPMQCCRPQTFGGCTRDPFRPYGGQSPDFLRNVCCRSSHECCVRNQNINPAFLSYACCDTANGNVCNVEDGEGSCIEATSGNGTTPSTGVEHLEAGGQCPLDGSLPARFPDGQVVQCSLNVNINAECPANHYCVRDNSGNVNAGVCCIETSNEDGDMIGCDQYETCHDCVRNEDRVQAACGWLSQGSLSNVNPRCVKNCDNFPSKSCILPSGGELCPVTNDDSENGTVVNTGTCERRCGYIGTGRAARINNNGNQVPPTPENVTVAACCEDYPGDACCDIFGQIATHCERGRRSGSQVLCGIPLRGTPNALYVPANEPLGPYMPQQPTPYMTQFGPFPPYGQPYGYGPHRPNNLPYGPAPYPGPVPYGPGPMPYGPVPYGPMWRQGEELTDSKYLYFVPPPMYLQPLPPPRPPRPTPPIVNINPSPFVCSCDDHCGTYDDCCSDYAEFCVLTEDDGEEEEEESE